MIKADLHIHTKDSSKPLPHRLAQCFNIRESYSEPEEMYEQAKKRKMDIIAITNHNTFKDALYLSKKFPKNVIAGCEYDVLMKKYKNFIHVVVLDITKDDHTILNKLRFKGLYPFLNYVKKKNLIHHWAHPSYSINYSPLKKQMMDYCLEKFERIEVINSLLDPIGNKFAQKIAKIKNKKIIAVSDAHTPIDVGKSYISADAKNKKELLDKLRKGDLKIEIKGKNLTPKSFLNHTEHILNKHMIKTCDKIIENPQVKYLYIELFGPLATKFTDKKITIDAIQSYFDKVQKISKDIYDEYF